MDVNDPELLAAMSALHARPEVEYEDITIREVAIGFSSGVQEITLYPEDEMEVDGAGNIQITFHTMGDGEFVAYAGHTEWHSLRNTPHKRVKGTLRPDPRQMMADFGRRRQEATRERIRKLQEELGQD